MQDKRDEGMQLNWTNCPTQQTLAKRTLIANLDQAKLKNKLIYHDLVLECILETIVVDTSSTQTCQMPPCPSKEVLCSLGNFL